MKNTFSATSNKATPEGSTHCLLIIWRKLGQKNLCYSVMSITKEMTLNDNSLLQYLKKPEKNDKRPPPKVNTSTIIKNQKYLPQTCAAETLKMRLGRDLQQDILLLRIPPLLFMEKGKLENDVDHKINKLCPEPGVSK